MRKASAFVHGVAAGILEESEKRSEYVFRYHDDYRGEPISLTMPLDVKEYRFSEFPSFFDGLLPEGLMLEGLLRKLKLDRNDRFSQLVAVGRDLVGAVTVEETV